MYFSYRSFFIRTADITGPRAGHVTTCRGDVSRPCPNSDGPEEEEEDEGSLRATALR